MVHPDFVWVGHSAFGPNNNWPVCSLILRKISKTGATICWILTFKCTKFAFQAIRFPLGLCSSHWGSSQRSPSPLSVFKGPTSKEREGKEREREEKVKGREGRATGWIDLADPQILVWRPLCCLHDEASWLKANIHYASFPVASPVTSWQLPCLQGNVSNGFWLVGRVNSACAVTYCIVVC